MWYPPTGKDGRRGAKDAELKDLVSAECQLAKLNQYSCAMHDSRSGSSAYVTLSKVVSVWKPQLERTDASITELHANGSASAAADVDSKPSRFRTTYGKCGCRDA